RPRRRVALGCDHGKVTSIGIAASARENELDAVRGVVRRLFELGERPLRELLDTIGVFQIAVLADLKYEAHRVDRRHCGEEGWTALSNEVADSDLRDVG